MKITDKKKLVTGILESIGEDTTRDGLIDTPDRVVRSWEEIYSGYKSNPAQILRRSFELSNYDQLIVEKHISFFSMCEHHMLPFWGTVSIGYLPCKGRVVGASKLIRVIDCFARRLQIQERLTQQIADTFMEVVKPQGVGVIIEAQHLCISSRGAKNITSVFVTSAMEGAFRTRNSLKMEFLGMIKK